jgi:hypothetical protein
VLDEPRLGGLRRRLEDQVGDVDLVRDLVDEAGSHLAGRAEDPGGAALAPLGYHLPGTGGTLLLDPLDPQIRSEVDLGVLRADLGEHDEVTREFADQLQLAFARDLDGAVRELHMSEPELRQPALVPVDLVGGVDGLEEGAADDNPLLAEDFELPAEIRGDVRGPPAELDDVDVIAARLEDVFPRARAEALVDHVSQAAVAWLKDEQRSPSTASARPPGRRGRESCRGRRFRR